jgi:hypothetical protein
MLSSLVSPPFTNKRKNRLSFSDAIYLFSEINQYSGLHLFIKKEHHELIKINPDLYIFVLKH